MYNFDENKPMYLRDLTREERELICRYRMMNKEEKSQLSEDVDKHTKNNLQSNAKDK